MFKASQDDFSVTNPTTAVFDVAQASRVELLDRDQSILAFNERALDWAYRPEVPLLERLRFLCIVSSNLDEIFEVRAELNRLLRQVAVFIHFAALTNGFFQILGAEILAVIDLPDFETETV